MKTSLFIFILLFAATASYSQGKNKIAIVYGAAANGLFTGAEPLGGPNYDGKGAALYELQFVRKLNRHFSLETGVSYSLNKILVRPQIYPGISQTGEKTTISMISIPVRVRYTLLKYFFINAGPSIDLETHPGSNEISDKQSGIGLGLGIGGQYHFGKMTVFVNPFVQKHAVLPFERTRFQRRLNEAGSKLGLAYNF